MLAKMVGAQFLGLVKAPEDVAQSAPTETQNTEPSQANDNLQGEAPSSAPLENDPAAHFSNVDELDGRCSAFSLKGQF